MSITNLKLEDFKAFIRGKKVAVIGVGISNRPLIKFLYKLGAQITAFDILPEDDEAIIKTKKEFKEANINLKWSLGKDYLKGLNEEFYDIVFKTPKMRPELPELVEAKEKGSILTSEMEVFMALCPCDIFAITGSDGKTTTTTLCAEILNASGYNVFVGGNIGTPLLDRIESICATDKVVLELSSFQLLTMTLSPDYALVTNVTPNHLDFHEGYEEYIEAKTKVFRNQNFNGKTVLFAANDITFDMHNITRGKTGFFALTRDEIVNRNIDSNLYDFTYVDEDGYICYEAHGKVRKLFKKEEIFIIGEHNVLNYLAAINLVYNFVNKEAIINVATKFKGVEHRIEFVRDFKGVRYYNSSIDTSPNRTINTMKALKSRDEHGTIIVGGADKKCVYDGLGDAILNVCDKIILRTGGKLNNAELVKENLKKEANGRKYEVYEVSTMEEAVSLANKISLEGEIVILSPVGTSYDHYRHFEVRGNEFKSLVLSL